MNANQIIRRPLVTEKSTMLREDGDNVIAFEVDPKANKIQVKSAVEELFKVKVEEVRLFNVRGKMKRMGRYAGKRRDWRKAYVRLKAGREGARLHRGRVAPRLADKERTLWLPTNTSRLLPASGSSRTLVR